ncbi:MAG TPA: ferrochelatase [Polyangiaceae bacterium]|nr:ferrochelatase [Polyangiaceae bacterium]
MKLRAGDGVLLVAHGTVTNLDDLPGFLARIRHGRPASPELLADLRRRYEAVGGSPLLEITRAQASALASRLDLPVLVGMRLWEPSVEDALRGAAHLGIKRLVVLPLAPFSVAVYWQAAQSSLESVRSELGASAPELVPVPAWGEDPAFVAAHAAAIRTISADLPGAELLLSAHSLPLVAIRSGDRYQSEVEACARAIGARLNRDYRVVYQSQGADGGEWLGPDLRAELRGLREQGKNHVVLAPFGFLADHVETLYDLDVEARGWAEELGLRLLRVPALNTDEIFIGALANVAERALANC